MHTNGRRAMLLNAAIAVVLSGALYLIPDRLVAEEVAPAAGPPIPQMTPELRAEIKRAEAENDAMPDTPGTGPYGALKEEDPTLPDHVVYRPRDLAALHGEKLGILAWGNGGCGDDGANVRQHLAEIASHGYLVIANGTIKSGPGVTAPKEAEAGPPSGGGLPPPKTKSEQLTQAIDWALGENQRKGSRYFGKLDAKAIAVSGWSCGGLQALKIASVDARVKTTIIHNSGIFSQPTPWMGIDISKASLEELKRPILYVLGGKTDIAFANGSDDFARIRKVPAVLVSLEVGHGGTFYKKNGGKVTPIDVAWLGWQLRGDEKAAHYFLGKDCILCRQSEFTVSAKGF